MDVKQRFNVNLSGQGTQPMVFAHGYGCDQSMWRWVAPAFERDYRVVLFDLAGSGQADPSAYDRMRHATLRGYARDVLELVTELDLHDVIFVGHSVSAIIGILAAIERPEHFARLILVGPSPCYIDAGDYRGGFSREDIDGLLDALDSNYLGWADTSEQAEPETGVGRTRADIARAFARVAFLSDNRPDLAHVHTRSLILQVTDDLIAPVTVGEYMQRSLCQSELVLLESRGHCPQISVPAQTIAAMRGFLGCDAAHVTV